MPARSRPANSPCAARKRTHGSGSASSACISALCSGVPERPTTTPAAARRFAVFVLQRGDDKGVHLAVMHRKDRKAGEDFLLDLLALGVRRVGQQDRGGVGRRPLTDQSCGGYALGGAGL